MLSGLWGEGEGAWVSAFADVGQRGSEQVDGAADGVGETEFGLHAQDVALDVLVLWGQQSGVFEKLELS